MGKEGEEMGETNKEKRCKCGEETDVKNSKLFIDGQEKPCDDETRKGGRCHI